MLNSNSIVERRTANARARAFLTLKTSLEKHDYVLWHMDKSNSMEYL